MVLIQTLPKNEKRIKDQIWFGLPIISELFDKTWTEPDTKYPREQIWFGFGFGLLETIKIWLQTIEQILNLDIQSKFLEIQLNIALKTNLVLDTSRVGNQPKL